MATALKVFGWQGFRSDSNLPRGMTREIVAAPTQIAAARIAGVKRPGQLFNFCETGNRDEIAAAMAQPGVVMYRGLDDRKTPFKAAPPAASAAPKPTPAPTPAAPVAAAQPQPDPCPCCGGQATVLTGAHEFVDAKVCCEQCGMEGGLETDHPTAAGNAANAVAVWNRRLPTPAAAAVLRAAERYLSSEAQRLQPPAVPAKGAAATESRVKHQALLQLAAELRALRGPGRR